MTSLFESILIFCDGACSGNPGRGGWGGIIVLPEGRIKEMGGEAFLTTNNQMELMAVIETLRWVQDKKGPVHIFTDSVYVIRGITQWIWGWRKKGWKTAEGKEVANRELWQELSSLVSERTKENPIEWGFVRGHTGVPGNERVDEIAVAFSRGEGVNLFQGSLLKYHVPIHEIPEDREVPEMKPKKEAKPAAFSYLSLIGDMPMRHMNWAECERRVKGRSGAKYKKAMSAEEELAILEGWGIDAKLLK